MNRPSRLFEHAEVSAAALPRTREAERQLSALLGENEIIELTRRPSLWFIAITSARFIAAMALLVAAAVWFEQAGMLGATLPAITLFCGAAAARVGLASLQWASRLYILTNRRVLAYRGVWHVQVSQCPLVRVAKADLTLTSYQKVMRIGSVQIVPSDDLCGDVLWEHVAEPTQTYQTVVRAIRRAQSGGG